MVDGIEGPGASRPYAGQRMGAPHVTVRQRGNPRRESGDDGSATDRDPARGGWSGGGRGFQTYMSAPAARAPMSRATAAYGRTGPGGGTAQVVMSRSAAILADLDLDGALERAGETIKQLASTLLEIDSRATDGLLDHFKAAGLDWVRQALMRYRAYAEHHDNLPVGLVFEDVKVSVNRALGDLDIEVGGVHFRTEFDFRAVGVVFDVRGTSAVDRPSPGFFVDTGDHGADTADEIIERVRRDLPGFGSGEGTRGVCVLIRSDSSDYSHDAGVGYVIDMDLLVPFSATWSGG